MSSWNAASLDNSVWVEGLTRMSRSASVMGAFLSNFCSVIRTPEETLPTDHHFRSEQNGISPTTIAFPVVGIR
jgi:hypothetical protein